MTTLTREPINRGYASTETNSQTPAIAGVQQSAFDKLVDFYGLQGVQKVYAMFVGTLGVTGAADALNRAASQLGNTSAQELEAVLASVDTGASTD